MASIVQAGIPVSRNVPMQMAQIANALQTMRARRQMAQLEQERLTQQEKLEPFKEEIAREQLGLGQQRLAQQRELQQYREAHPETALSGLAQQFAYFRGLQQQAKTSPSSTVAAPPSLGVGAPSLSPQPSGAPEEVHVGQSQPTTAPLSQQQFPDIRSAANAAHYFQQLLRLKNLYQQSKAHYYDTLSHYAESGRKDLPASLVPYIYATSPHDSKIWDEIAPQDRANVKADAQGLVARKMATPTILNQIQFLGTASDLLDKSNRDLAFIMNKSNLQGYPKLLEMKIGKVLEKIGQDSPEYNHRKSFEMQQKLLSAEIRRLINSPNVSEESKDMLRTINVDWRNMSLNNIIRQREILANFLESQKRRLAATVSPDRIQHPMIPVTISHLRRGKLGQIIPSSDRIRVQTKDGRSFSIPKSQLDEAKASGLMEAQ